jgi:hypothetical protein
MTSHILTARIEPTHLQMSKLLKAYVVQSRRAYALHEAGILDLEEDVRIEARLLLWDYTKYHGPQTKPVTQYTGEQSKAMNGQVQPSIRDKTADTYIFEGGLNALSSYNHEHKGGAT